MANNRIQIKRTTISGRTPNTTNSSNSAYIAAGELAINLTDKKVYTSNGSTHFEVGSNVSTLTVDNILANGISGTAGQVLKTSGSSVYWDDSASGLNATLATYTYTITSNTSTISGIDDESQTLNYTEGLESVFINGSRQIAGIDYTTPNTSTIVLTSNVISGEVVQVVTWAAEIVAYDANAAYAWTNTHTFSNTVTLQSSLLANTINATSVSIGSTIVANTTGTYATHLGGVAAEDYQLESGLSANVATLTANNTSYAYGKQESQLNVNNAVTAETANNATHLGGTAANGYQTTAGLAANVATLAANSALHANNATYAYGKIEGDLNANSALAANNAAHLGGELPAYYTNASNISTGTLAEARLPYRMDQNVRTTDTVEFGNITVTGNLTVSGTTVTINANTLSIQDNMIYLNDGGANANPDLGWAGNYNDGTYRHAGMFRDASDGKFKIFDQFEPEPDGPWIDTANSTFRIADFEANTLYISAISANGTVGTNNSVLVSNGSTVYWGSVSGGIQYTVKAANYTAVDKDGIIADTSGGAFTITLPATPDAGAQVVIVDGADFFTNNLTVARNGSTIESNAEDLILDITGVSVTFIYSGTTWQVYTQVGASAASPTYKVVSTTYTASARDNIIANTNGGSFTITLPASPSLGDEVIIADGGAFGTNSLTVGRNGSTIEGSGSDLVLNITGIRTHFVYSGGTWQVYAQGDIGGLSLSPTANNALYLGGVAANAYALKASPTLTGNTSTANLAVTGTLSATGNVSVTGNVSITNTLTANAISANGSVGTNGQVLTSNATSVYWATVTVPANTSLTNPTVTNYTETTYTPAANTSFTVDLNNGTVQKLTSSGNLTVTLPASTTGKSYVIMISYGGAHSLTWAGGSTIKWASNTTPTATSTTGKIDIFSFFCDGTNTYGSIIGQNY